VSWAANRCPQQPRQPAPVPERRQTQQRQRRSGIRRATMESVGDPTMGQRIGPIPNVEGQGRLDQPGGMTRCVEASKRTASGSTISTVISREQHEVATAPQPRTPRPPAHAGDPTRRGPSNMITDQPPSSRAAPEPDNQAGPPQLHGDQMAAARSRTKFTQPPNPVRRTVTGRLPISTGCRVPTALCGPDGHFMLTRPAPSRAPAGGAAGIPCAVPKKAQPTRPQSR